MHEAWLPREHALHRPRHGGRQWTALVCASIFFAVPVLSVMFGARPAEIENRPPAEFPSLSQGWGFFTGLSQWATDHLVFRAAAVQAADGISRGVFGEPAPFDQGDNDQSGPLTGSTGDTSQTTQPGQSQPGGADGDSTQPAPGGVDPNVNGRAVEGKDGWLYYSRDMDAKCNPAQPLDQTIQQVQRLRQVVEASGRRFVFVVAPDKTTMVPETLPDDYPNKECAQQATAQFWQRVPTETGALDIRQRLEDEEASIHRVVYHKLDTHWTDEAGIVLAKAVAEQVRPGVTATWQDSEGQSWQTKADLPPLQGRTGTKSGHFYRLRPDGSENRTQSMPESFNSQVVRFSTPPITGTVSDRVGWLGDSFTLPTGPYLGAAFNDISLVHYQVLADHTDDVINMLTDRQVIAVEVVERTLASGSVPFLNPSFIDRLGQALAAHPVN
ncbi:alginate O-acetyltransferase AlgX-related protein [Goodfellowiella coeruleoviolacea]|uniref:SGNH hydrolase-like domain-containing protein, acetyltransferase AlgX n=1 Tax=Goodfellowiella coeruleoviolacea TaxID=334858 RepID=A0AAE3GCG0_9PSEU|nr:hypothetical protein [Goodfellowiella coeruleoviolacea]MCP2164712.1 SGNH hydrolase-like domain-containing protein, acetyltransferase AlgX [Goodfellowiella coeruleoviolacea]